MDTVPISSHSPSMTSLKRLLWQKGKRALCRTITVLGYQLSLYGPCVLLGFLAGVSLCVWYAQRRYGNGRSMLYACLITFAGVMLGGKLMAGLYRLPALLRGAYADMSFWQALRAMFEGTRYFGYFAGGWLTAGLYCRRFRLNPYEMIVAGVPSIPLIEAFVRLGCVLTGCCYGIPWSGFMATVFPAGAEAPAGVALFPWQAAALWMNLLLLALLLWYRSRHADPSPYGRGIWWAMSTCWHTGSCASRWSFSGATARAICWRV